MSGPVDVLGTLSRAIQCDPSMDVEIELMRVRSAVAELIEASSRFSSHGTRSARQIDDDWDRLRAALARVKGESQ